MAWSRNYGELKLQKGRGSEELKIRTECLVAGTVLKNQQWLRSEGLNS
jgi:hypothetical protein